MGALQDPGPRSGYARAPYKSPVEGRASRIVIFEVLGAEARAGSSRYHQSTDRKLGEGTMFQHLHSAPHLSLINIRGRQRQAIDMTWSKG